jgi:RNA polymerase sigma-70 factor (ECF subfamily)
MSREAPPNEVSDETLIRGFLEGRELSFRALYRRHTPRLRMVLLRTLGERRAEVEDALQETWLAAARSLHMFRGEARFSTWLTTIGIRVARARLFAIDLGSATLLDEEIAAPHSESSIRIDLERAIERLPARQRIVLVLHDVEGFTHEEIARALEMPVGTSKVTLSRARTKLRTQLTEGKYHVC